MLSIDSSMLVKQLSRTEDYARLDEMKFINVESKVLLFNPCHSLDFMLEILLQNHWLYVVEEMKLLGAET